MQFFQESHSEIATIPKMTTSSPKMLKMTTFHEGAEDDKFIPKATESCARCSAAPFEPVYRRTDVARGYHAPHVSLLAPLAM